MHFFSFVYLFSYHYFAGNFLSYFVIQDSAAFLLKGTFMFHKTNLTCFKEGLLLIYWTGLVFYQNIYNKPNMPAYKDTDKTPYIQ